MNIGERGYATFRLTLWKNNVFLEEEIRAAVRVNAKTPAKATTSKNKSKYRTDSAEELLRIKEAENHIMPRNERSCIAYGTPRVTVKPDAVVEGPDLKAIPEAIGKRFQNRRSN